MISKTEFMDVFYEVDEDLWRKFLLEVDKNDDGLISYDEFFASMTSVIRRNSTEKVRRFSQK